MHTINAAIAASLPHVVKESEQDRKSIGVNETLIHGIDNSPDCGYLRVWHAVDSSPEASWSLMLLDSVFVSLQHIAWRKAGTADC